MSTQMFRIKMIYYIKILCDFFLFCFDFKEEEELKRKKEETVQASSVTSIDLDITEEKDAESSLWVEKYRPISYMHLLSEEVR